MMRVVRTVVIVFLALLFVHSFRVSAQDRDMELRDPAVVQFASIPEGAWIFHGDSLLGQAPIHLSIPASWDSVTFVYPSFEDWNAVTKTIAIPARGVQAIFRVQLPVKVVINSNPFGAEVFDGDSLIGTTPCVYTLLDERKELIIRKAKYENTSVVLEKKNISAINADLQLLPSVALENRVTEYSSTFRLPKSSIMVTGGVGLAAGVTSVLLKRHANNLYDQYRTTGNPELLSGTHRYDIYAGIALVLLQASLGYLVYLFMGE